jgi:hypothetical protein
VLSRALNMPSLPKGTGPAHLPISRRLRASRGLQEIKARRVGLCRVRTMVGDVPRVEQSQERAEHG